MFLRKYSNLFHNFDLKSWIPCKKRKPRKTNTNFKYLSKAQCIKIATEKFQTIGGNNSESTGKMRFIKAPLHRSPAILQSTSYTLKILFAAAPLTAAYLTEDCANPLYFSANSTDALPQNIYALKLLIDNNDACQWVLNALNNAGCNITRLPNLLLSGTEIDKYCYLMPPSPPSPQTNGANDNGIALLAMNGTLTALTKDLLCIINDLKNSCHSEEETNAIISYVVGGIVGLALACCIYAWTKSCFAPCIKTICDAVKACLNCISDSIQEWAGDCHDAYHAYKERRQELHRVSIANEVYNRFPNKNDPHRWIICQYAEFMPVREQTESKSETVLIEEDADDELTAPKKNIAITISDDNLTQPLLI